MARTFALIAQVHPVLHRASWSYEMITNAPKHYEMHQNMSLGSNGLDQVLWLRKITARLHGTNFCIIIAPVQYVLHQVSSSYETIPNAPKYYETDWNISLESNMVDWVRSLQKILTWLCGTNFCINCTDSPCFSPSFMHLRNDPKCTEILWNGRKH